MTLWLPISVVLFQVDELLIILIKVDLEKAYDRLNWDFIQDTLTDIGLHFSLTSLIMKCVTLVAMRVNWSDELIDAFSPSRGIR